MLTVIYFLFKTAALCIYTREGFVAVYVQIFDMRRWSHRRRAYSGVGSSCPNGILLTLVTSGPKYRSSSNVHRAVSDSQDRMCSSTDGQMDIAPAQMLLLGQRALLGSHPAPRLPWAFCPWPARAVDLTPRGDVVLVWIWTHLLQAPVGKAPPSQWGCVDLYVVRGLTAAVKKTTRNTLNILPWPSSISIFNPSAPPSLPSS